MVPKQIIWSIGIPLLFTVGPFLFSGVVGGWHQKRCLRKTAEREQQYLQANNGDKVHTIPKLVPERQINNCGLVMTSIVVGPSWWQLFGGAMKGIFGGRVKSYDRVLTWGRKEALQRLREQAISQGWSDVINVRMDTSVISSNKGNSTGNKTGSLEIFAYGTGIN